MDQEEIDRLLEEVLGPPPMQPRRVSPLPRSLDGLFASRTHVRVLRVLAAEDQRTNLTARDVARRARASHSRVLEVLRQLSSLALVRALPRPSYTIYHLDQAHPLTAAVRSLFDEERRTCEGT
jgi:hypothetical protein